MSSLNKPLDQLKIALVHDFLATIGGGERVVMALHALFPDAPVYTLRYDPEGTHQLLKDWDIRVAPLSQSWLGRSATLSLPFQPNAIESFDLSEYDLVISSSSAFAKGVLTQPGTLHLCYCHTPMRFVWDWTHEYARENNYVSGPRSIAGRLVTHYLRLWDQASATRVDGWIANSTNVAERIKKYYHQEATVIYPPVALPTPSSQTDSPEKEPYFLIVSRLSPYKKIDLAIEAAARLKHRLLIIGTGQDRERLIALAQHHQAPVSFLSYQDDQAISRYYSHSRAFLFPGEDDFGITPVEAMSFGKPVIAYGVGGAKETVVDKKTGLFFNQPTTDSLVATLEEFLKTEGSFKAADCRERAEQFSAEVFSRQIKQFVEDEWAKFQKQANS